MLLRFFTALVLCVCLTVPSYAQNPNIGSDYHTITLHDTPQTIGKKFSFYNPEGTRIRLSDYEGQYVLLNLWAVWCPPCIVELPSLDALQREIPAERLKIIPLSIGKETLDELKDVFTDLDVRTIEPYVDIFQEYTIRITPARGLPTTLLIAPNGIEIARVEGDIDWSAPEIVTTLKDIINGSKQ